MIFCQVDVTFYTHAKFRTAGLDGQGLWLAGLAYARQHETDGVVPEIALPLFGARRVVDTALRKLIDIGLWRKIEGGYVIDKYAEKGNQTRAQIAAAREAARQRKEKSRASGRGHGVTSPSVTQQKEHVTSPSVTQQSSAVPSHFSSHSHSLSETDPDPENADPAIGVDTVSGVHAVASAEVAPATGVTPIQSGSRLTSVVEAYEDAARAALGSFAMARFADRDLIPAVNGHTPAGLSGPELRARVRASVTAYIEATRDQAKFQGGWQPKGWLGWLNDPTNSRTLSEPVGANADARANSGDVIEDWEDPRTMSQERRAELRRCGDQLEAALAKTFGSSA